MLTTNLRTTQTLDPTIGVAPAATATCGRRRGTSVGQESVTAPVYRNVTARPSFSAFGPVAAAASFDASWSSIERKPMPKVTLHPDRWPLHSTS